MLRSSCQMGSGWLVAQPYRTPVGARQGPCESRKQGWRRVAGYIRNRRPTTPVRATLDQNPRKLARSLGSICLVILTDIPLSSRCTSGGRGQFPIGQTAKARSGYRVQSLRKGRDRQCRTHPIQAVTAGLVKIAPRPTLLWV
jgi:hypothetical protein